MTWAGLGKPDRSTWITEPTLRRAAVITPVPNRAVLFKMIASAHDFDFTRRS
jgi:hypothetical protein